MSKKNNEKNETIKPKVTKVKDSEPVIYLGPSLRNGMLQQFSVFNNGIPAYLAGDIEKCPAIKALMVPIAKSAIARNKLSEKGALEHTLYAQIHQYVRSEN